MNFHNKLFKFITLQGVLFIFFVNFSQAQIGGGSGFLISEQGYVITNYHVVDDPKIREIKVITNFEGSFSNSYIAKIIAIDKDHDIALLKIDIPGVDLKYGLKWDNYDVGEEITVLGYPKIAQLGTEVKVTTGIINALSGSKNKSYEFTMQAPIQSGNSGGPVFDNGGNIIGIASSGWVGGEIQNVNYAVKLNMIKNIIPSTGRSIDLLPTINLSNMSNPDRIKLYKKGTVLILVYETSSYDQVRLAIEREKQEKLQLAREQELKRQQAIYQEKLKEVNSLVEQGNSKFDNKDFEGAKTLYIKALEILPDNYNALNGRNEANKMISFLNSRNTRYYEYNTLNHQDYNRISKEIYEGIFDLRTNEGKYSAQLTLRRDLNNNTTYQLTNVRKSGVDFTNEIENLAKGIFLQKSTKYGYTVQTEAIFNIDFDVTSEQVKASRSAFDRVPISGQERIANIVNQGPMGNYTINLNYGTINGKEFENNKVTSFRGTGGPINALKSVIIPGMGVKPVTGGRKSGFQRTFFTYAFLGAGIGCKIYSSIQYRNYQNATVQEDMNSYYEDANNYNYAFYGFSAVAGAIWLYDIGWVTARGFKNQSEARRYKRSISLGIQPDPLTPSLALNYVFR